MLLLFNTRAIVLNSTVYQSYRHDRRNAQVDPSHEAAAAIDLEVRRNYLSGVSIMDSLLANCNWLLICHYVAVDCCP